MTDQNTPAHAANPAGDLPQDDNKLIAERREKLQALRANGVAFPNDFRPEQRAGDLQERFKDVENEALEAEPVAVSVAGRMMLKRVMGKAAFATVQDSSGLTSLPAFPIAVKMGSKPHVNLVQLTTVKDDVKHLYTLHWTKPAAAAKFYVLYKNTGKGFEMFTSVPGNQNEYSDTYSKNENTVYALTVQYEDNTTSEMIK